ncbi:MAG: hypothetical protein PUC99_04160 [Eubacteriales bacterium]|nr:hypothetical protein [Lachnospiraceae bacterium]MCI1334092.1 hypothetical protein [Lachnospiraceae bacterium]MCI1358262.1 hypothetical protein [Lachnospiraceae bacterium]MCI1454890.1 hypothetical protein [Lachnospiraceae bacterium]MDD5859519.1 hypothetical protein [Eubacteriales bacterium]
MADSELNMALVYNQSLPFAFSVNQFTGKNETDFSGTEERRRRFCTRGQRRFGR